jgi:hypothetical protein
MSDFIPDSQFKPDQQAAPASADFVPDNQFSPDEDNPIETAKAGVEGLERGLTLGASDVARTKLEGYLPESLQSKPEDLSRRIEQSPVASTVGNVVGVASLIGATGGVGGLLPEAAGAVAKIAATSAEGGLFGAGNAVTDYALGDPDLNAQKIMSHIGTGMLIGGVLGTLGETVLPYVGGKAKDLIRALRGSKESIPTPSFPGGEPPGGGGGSGGTPLVSGTEIQGGPVVSDAPQTGIKKTSYEEIASKVANAKYSGESLELPQKQFLQDASNRVEMMNPVHPLQLESLGSQTARDSYGTFKEMPGETGDALRNYEALQKNELTKRTENDIQLIAPGHNPVSDAVEGGNKAIEAFTDQYQNEKNSLGSEFEKLKQTKLQFNGNALTDAVNKMTDAVPGIAHMFNPDAVESIKILPYKTKWGIDKATYNAVKEAVGSLKENPTDFEEIQNIRNGLKQHVDVTAQGQAPQQIRSLGKAMMDFLQESLPEGTNARETFKRYAINEQERAVIEKAFGASVGTPEFGAISKVKPEYIGDKIFSNTATTAAAKNILPKEDFNKILANWLTENKVKYTDKGTFSSNKWNTFLTKNQDSLNAAFSDNPAALQKIKDYATIMRMLPDAASINPSGTAKTLMAMLKNVHGAGDLASMALHFAKDKTIGKIQEGIQLQNLNNKLAGKSAQATVASEIKKIIEKATNKIDTSAKSIFNGNTIRGGAVGVAVHGIDGYEKKVKSITDMASNPQKTSDNLAYNSEHLYNVAPNITQGLHTASANAISFLNSKVPKPGVELPLSSKWEPTYSQKAQFNRYYNAVNDPVTALKDIKSGTLSNETMEAIAAVHPQLLQEMRQKVSENIHPEKARNLNYATKISLSKFMGQPMDEGMIPQVFVSNQSAFTNAPQSQQGQAHGGHKRGSMAKLEIAEPYKTGSQKLQEGLS